MTTPGKAKGAAFEWAIMRVFNASGYPYVERRPAGATIDKGDLVGFAAPVLIDAATAMSNAYPRGRKRPT